MLMLPTLVLIPFLWLAPAPPVTSVPATGEEPWLRAWTADVGGARDTLVEGVHPVGDLVLVADAAGGVTALESADGSLRWFVQLQAPLSVPPSVGGGQLVLATEARMVVVDAATGRRLLEAGLESPLAASPVSDGERVYLPLLAGRRVSAVSLATGRQIWDIRTPDTPVGAAQLVGGVVVVSSMDGSVRGLRTAARAVREIELWSRREGPLVGAMVRRGDQLFLATEARAVLALEGTSGRVLWRTLPGGRLLSEPLPAGPVIVVQTSEGTVGLDAASGRERWRVDPVLPLAAVPGAVAVRRADGEGAALDPENGTSLLEGLPGELQASGPFLLTVEQGRRLVAWRVVGS